MQLERHVKKKHTFTWTKCDRTFIAKKDLKEHNMLPLFSEMSDDEDSNLLSGQGGGLMDN